MTNRHSFRGALAALFVVLSLTAVGSAQASTHSVHTEFAHPNSATGTSPIGSFNYSVGGASISVPVGCFLTHRVVGSGQSVEDDFAGVDCVGPAAVLPGFFCNWQFKFEFYNDRGTRYFDTVEPVTHSCNTSIGVHHSPIAPFLADCGQACVRFIVNATVRASQCHSITG